MCHCGQHVRLKMVTERLCLQRHLVNLKPVADELTSVNTVLSGISCPFTICLYLKVYFSKGILNLGV